MSSPFAAESLWDPAGLVVLSAPDGTDAVGHTGADSETDTDTDVAERLSSLPCVVIAVDRSAEAAPPWADVAPEDGVATIDDLLRTIDGNPTAATSLALLLRRVHRSLGPALVAESAVFSLLQSGPEFATWRAGRTGAGAERGTGAAAEAAVRLERRGDRLDLVLNRPETRNALNRAVRDGLLNGLTLAAADPALTHVVLRGEGPSFSSGGDLDEFGTFTDPAAAHLVRLTTSIGRAIDALGRRLIAEVHGPCAGSGVELPAFAAHVVARADFTATLPEVSLGLIPGAGGTVSITRRVGRHRMALLALSGARIDAATASRWGLVDEVVPV